MKKPVISPSLLSADFLNLGRSVKLINESEADWLHIDVMDGVYVPNISFGFPVLDAVSLITSKPFDIHLMIANPDNYLERFLLYKPAVITVHYDACTHLHRTLQLIKKAGVKAGVSLNPHQPVQLLEDILPETDMVLIMSVNPGYGGQQFIGQTFSKIEKLVNLIKKSGYNTLIQVDGGVDLTNAARLVNAGADILVAGNAIFKANDPRAMIRDLKNIPL